MNPSQTETAVTTAWSTEIEAWRLALRATRLSPQTIELRTYHIRRLARAGLAPTPWSLQGADLLTWLGQFDWSRETARTVRSSTRRFWAWGIATGRTDENASDALPPIPPVQPRPRPAASEAVVRAIRNASPSVTMMIRLANELGLRRAEVAQVYPENDLVRDLVGWSLIVHGKGSRKRTLPLPDDLAEVLRSAPPGYLFPSPTGGHVTPHWVGTLVSRALADGTTMHQLRHLCATEIHDQTHDVRLVQTVLGHSSLATTPRYIAVEDGKLRDAIATRSKRWATE